MQRTLPLFILLFTAAPLPARAADAPAGTLYQLSPQEVNAIKARAAGRSEAPVVPIDTINIPEALSPARKVHGEIGLGIGTNGYRSVFGTAVYPLGDDSFVAFSFENSDFGDNRRLRRR